MRPLRHQGVDYEQPHCPRQDASTDQRARAPLREAQALSSVQARNDQGKGRGGEHDPRAKTQQPVGHRHRHAANHQHRHRTERRPQRAQRPAFQRPQHARFKTQPSQSLIDEQPCADQQQHRADGQTKQACAAEGEEIRRHRSSTSRYGI